MIITLAKNVTRCGCKSFIYFSVELSVKNCERKRNCDIILKNGVKLDGVVNTVVYETMV